MKKIFLVLALFFTTTNSQNLNNEIKISFRAYELNTGNMFVPGQFNGWGPNSGGQISPGAVSQMDYNQNLKCYIKTYTFKIKDPSDSQRSLGDSVYMYKFNRNGNTWFSDPFNSEMNLNDNNNSIIRLTRLMFFQVYKEVSNDKIYRVSAGISHALSDTIKSLKLYVAFEKGAIQTEIDLKPFYDENLQVVNYIFSTPIPSSYYLKIVARNNFDNEIKFESGGYAVKIKDYPAYVKNGVTLPINGVTQNTSFRLRASNKGIVLLRVAKENENLNSVEPILMNKTTDGKYWWTEALLSTGNYEYIFDIDDGKKFTDPFGREIGVVGSKFTVGPSGLTSDDYIWTSTNYSKPTLDKLVIYELSVMEYAGGFFNKPAREVTFKDLKILIPHFDSLGVNAIELMPINDWGNPGKSGFSWGYDLNHYFAIEPTLGTPKELKELIDEAHKKNIAVILDVVFNHQNESGPLWQIDQDENSNPYFKANSDMRPNEDALYFFKDMDHWTTETQEIVYESLKMWIEEYRIDGFRYDFTQGIGWDTFQPTKGILGWANKIDTLYKGKIYQIAEHLPESPALIYHSGMTSGWHDSFRDKIFDEARFRNVSLSDFDNLIIGLGAFGSNDYPSTPSSYGNRNEPVNGNVNHDEQSLIYEMTQFQGVSLSDAILRDKLYATFIFTSLGIPMLWEGMELGAPRGWRVDGDKLNYRPVEWNLYNTQQGKEHFKYYQRLAWQRRKNPALSNGILKKLYKFENEKVLVWGFEDPNTNSKVVCVANLSGSEQTILNVPWLSSVAWYDVFDQSIFVTTNTTVPSFTIPRYSARVFSNKKNEELGIIVPVKKEKNIPSNFRLKQNYPNPFNPTTRINFELPVESNVEIKITDTLGRIIQRNNLGKLNSGEHSFNLDLKTKKSGIYFYTLSTGNFTETKKMILNK